MRRRGKAAKTRVSKTSEGRNTAKVARRRKPSIADLAERIALLTRERDEALEQQKATSGVLRAISSSPTDSVSTLEAIAENVAKLLDVPDADLMHIEGDVLRSVAKYGPAIQWPLGTTRSLSRDWVTGRAVIDRTFVHIADLQARERDFPQGAAYARQYGHRTTLAVPLLREGSAIGAILIRRMEVRPFTDKQIELVQNFASQAVIAIENARLINELRESLQQQTATADVLKVISRSTFDLQAVLDTLVESAARLCDADRNILFRREGTTYISSAYCGYSREFQEFHERHPIAPGRGTAVGRSALEGKTIHIPDVLADPEYKFLEAQKLGDYRANLAVPLLRDGKPIGAFSLTRSEPRLFSGKQIELAETFADQAVIAIENARLLDELRERTDDLTESLQQQTATADVLKVISQSTFDLQKVLNTLTESAARLCEADMAAIARQKDEAYYLATAHNYPPELDEYVKGVAHERGRGTIVGRVLLEGKTIHVYDVLADAEYTNLEMQRKPGFRTVLGVPLLREGNPIGAIVLVRNVVRPFTDKQIELLKTFADQAGIAIANTRLLDELNKLNQQLEQRVADQVGEIERMGRLRRFLPPQVADLIVASGTEKQLDSHRREITALFCDLRGFTGFSESSDPEDVMTVLRDYHAAIGEIIIKYSGTLERYAGDGVMVVFNDPVPVENPALQAVQMALDMRAAIGALIEKWRRLGHELGFGIGIAHGFATLGTIGFEGRFDYAAIGTVSNVASRLCDEAKPGQILISPRVLTAVEDAVTVEPIGEFALKGIRRPLAAHNVLAAKLVN